MQVPRMNRQKHSEHSSFREKLIEHLFVGELLKLSWQDGTCGLEIASPEVDNAGYDLVAEQRGVIRHIQLKASYHGGRTSKQKVHVKLADKPSGCVVWIYFDEDTLQLGPFLFFGGEAGQPLPELGDKTARHTKGDRTGHKSERPQIRQLSKGAFTVYESIDELDIILFGSRQNGR